VNSIVGSIGNASPLQADAAPMIDPFGRAVTYLRVSVTDRCDFRCTYCMAENMTFLPKKDLLKSSTGSVPPSSPRAFARSG